MLLEPVVITKNTFQNERLGEFQMCDGSSLIFFFGRNLRLAGDLKAELQNHSKITRYKRRLLQRLPTNNSDWPCLPSEQF